MKTFKTLKILALICIAFSTIQCDKDELNEPIVNQENSTIEFSSIIAKNLSDLLFDPKETIREEFKLPHGTSNTVYSYKDISKIMAYQN